MHESSEWKHYIQIWGSRKDNQGISSKLPTDIEIEVRFAKIKEVKGTPGTGDNLCKVTELRICV